MLVKEIMVSPVITVKEDDTLEAVARILIKNRISCVPVIDDNNKIIGIITESEFVAENSTFPFSRVHAPKLFGKWMLKQDIEEMYKSARSMKASEIMNQNPVCTEEEQTVAELLDIMIKHDAYRIPVLKDNSPVGIVTRHDLLKLIINNP
jgi:CBS domain-containing protein